MVEIPPIREDLFNSWISNIRIPNRLRNFKTVRFSVFQAEFERFLFLQQPCEIKNTEYSRNRDSFGTNSRDWSTALRGSQEGIGIRSETVQNMIGRWRF
jgi:hypothetical protein